MPMGRVAITPLPCRHRLFLVQHQRHCARSELRRETPLRPPLGLVLIHLRHPIHLSVGVHKTGSSPPPHHGLAPDSPFPPAESQLPRGSQAIIAARSAQQH